MFFIVYAGCAISRYLLGYFRNVRNTILVKSEMSSVIQCYSMPYSHDYRCFQIIERKLKLFMTRFSIFSINILFRFYCLNEPSVKYILSLSRISVSQNETMTLDYFFSICIHFHIKFNC